MDATGYSSLSIELKSKTISDRFTIVKPVVINIDDVITGTLADFPFTCTAIKVSDKNNIYTATCAYSVEELMNKPLAITHQTGVSNALSAAITALGRTPAVSIDDFETNSMGETDPTYKDVISFWVGWTDIIPHKQINVFQRGSTIYALQRGKETSTYTIQRAVRTDRTREKVYTMLDTTNTDGTLVGGSLSGSTNTTAPVYKQGNSSFGDVTRTYTNGLVTREVYVNGSGETETTVTLYSSSTPPARITKKTTTISGTPDIREIVTDYVYSLMDGVYYLSKETETKYDVDSQQVTQRVTRHVPLGQDDWGVIIEVDGVTETKTLGQGPSSCDANPYVIRQGSSYTTSGGAVSVDLPGRLITGGSIPVVDQDSLERVADEIIWLNGKTKETVNLQVYDDHIIDFTEKVSYDGNEYYLDSNNVTNTIGKDGKFVQLVQLLRWY